ncbi:MAG: hypothetical protein MZV70_19045 [Desulfobacterales bacterium]|nr:hypothetical protein [Desulfobacterales bacterium]
MTIQEGELIVGMKTLDPARLARLPRDQLRLGRARPRPAGHAQGHALSRERARPSASCGRRCSPTGSGRQIADRIDAAVPPEIWKADERGVIYNYFRSRTIGHFQAAYDKVLAKGMEGIIADVEQSLARLDAHAAGTACTSASSWSR